MRHSTLVASVLVVAAAMLALVPSPAQGVVMKEDDFEGLPGSSAAYPDVSGDYDPNPAIWTTVENNANQVQLTTYGTPGPASGNSYLRLARNPQDAFVYTSHLGASDNPIYVKFDVYARSDKPFSAYFGIYDTLQFFIGLTDATSIDYLTPIGWVDTGVNATLDAWREFRFEINRYKDFDGPGSLDLWYDGVEVLTDIPLHLTPGVGAFHFLNGSGGSEWYVDNFEIGTPDAPDVPGDFNGDGTVDAADYVLWRKSPADYGNEDGYQDWVENFGTGGGGSGSGFGSVPEPSAFVLLFISAAGMSRLVSRARGTQSRREVKA